MKSRLFEDEIVLAYKEHGFASYFIDIGAGDGKTWSNSLLLAENGWGGVCIECNPLKFEFLRLEHEQRYAVDTLSDKVTAENIVPLLESVEAPKDPGLLSVDIDGIDAYVIQRILKSYHPQIIIAEYNHAVPPPVRFCVRYDPSWTWGVNHFFGASLDHFVDIVTPHGYGLTHVMGGNAIFMHNRPSTGTTEQLWRASHIPFIRLTNESDSLTLASAHPVNLGLEQRLSYVHQMFKDFEGKYDASLSPL